MAASRSCSCFGTCCFVLAHDSEFCLASRNQSAVVPDISSRPSGPPRPPLSILCPPVGGSLWNATSGPLSFWFPVGVSQWKPHMRQKGERRVGLGIHPLALPPFTGHLRCFLYMTISSWVPMISLSPCPMGPGGISFTVTSPGLLPYESQSPSMAAAPGNLDMQLSRPPRPSDSDTLGVGSGVGTNPPGESGGHLSLKNTALCFPLWLYAQFC